MTECAAAVEYGRMQSAAQRPAVIAFRLPMKSTLRVKSPDVLCIRARGYGRVTHLAQLRRKP